MNIMIDLETLGIEPSSVIVSVGLVAFDKERIVEEMSGVLDIQQQLDTGRTVNGSTLQWWMCQTDAARKVFNEPTTSATVSCEYMTSFFNKFPDAEVWGNGANFDPVLLESYYKSFGLKCPIKYSKVRCLRTFGSMVGTSYKIARTGEVTHNALQDARDQANYMLGVWKGLDKKIKL